jgi:hypothetical protein
MNCEGPDAKDKDIRILEDACIRLGQQFDTVQIFATRHNEKEGGTVNVHFGKGNWYARFGHIKLWVQFKENDIKFVDKKDEV